MNFSASADYYGEGRYVQREFINRFISNVQLGAEDEVLDVGCGTGEETREIAKQVKSITGIDASEEMIFVAKETNTRKNASFCRWDARTVGDNPEWKERFDKAVSFFVLHWLPEHSEAFNGILTCLKPGGEALILMCHGDECIPETNRFLKNHTKWGAYVKDKETTIYPWRHSIKDTEDILSSTGWTDIECQVQPFTPLSEMQTKVFLKTIFGQTSLIPEAMLEEYLEDMWQFVLSQYEAKTQQGYFLLPMLATVIHARKPPRD